MKRLLNSIREHFELTHNEAKSALIFFVIILVNLLLYYSYSTFSVNKQSEIIIENYGKTELPEKEESERKWVDYGSKNYPKRKIERFRFNPNTSSELELTRLGFPKYLSKTILNYRNKGGKFKYKEDLLKIYSMKPELYSDIESLVDLPSKLDKKSTDFEEHRVINESPKSTFAPKKNTSIVKFDLNTADTTQLMQIKGIGRVFANRIIKYRDILGGFHSIDQIAETYGLDPAVIPELQKYGTLNGQVKKIKINQLDNFRHPYLKYNQIKVITAYRKQHGNFKNADDLKQIKILDETTISKIAPYIEF
jgi:competence protein ComEA